MNAIPTIPLNPSVQINPNLRAHDTFSSYSNSSSKSSPKTGYYEWDPKRDENINVAFSTDCSFFQDWQSLILFYSALQVRQPGKVTRIASGCTSDDEKRLNILYNELFPSLFNKKFFVHFTPDFKRDPKTGESYDFYNKPFGIHHWLRFASPPLHSDTVVFLIDPDMLLLEPFTLNLRDRSRLQLPHHDNLDEIPLEIGLGYPVAQAYGLGAPWTNPNNRNFDKYKICGNDSPCTKYSLAFSEKHFR